MLKTCWNVLILLCLVSGVFAQTPDSTVNPMGDSSISQKSTERVPVPEMSEKAARYYRSGIVLWFVNTLWALLIPAFFLFTGLSARIRNWAQKLGRKWFFVIALYFIIFSLVSYVIGLPLSYYQDFVRQHAYDLSNQTFEKWFTDSLKNLMVGLILGALFLWVPYLLLKKSPTRWWLYTSILFIPFLVFIMLIAPIWIDPLFNDFGPMKNKELEGKILALADKAGIEGSRVFEVNKSVDTKTVNAYVTGFGGTKRIVLWDTILAKLDDQEVLMVMGHEMGHYVLGHVWTGILFFSLLVLVTLYAAYKMAGFLIARYKDRFGFDQLSDIASLPLILLLISIFSLVITPIAFTFTRHQEHEADRFGLEVVQNNHAAATAFVKLQEENLSNPRPGWLSKLWRSSHPTPAERIEFCNDYRPWEKGEPLKYGDLIKK
jgi:Zn-dependent protease with chaperone function